MATTGRLTKNSVLNLADAQRAGVLPADDGGVMVWTERNGNRSFLCNKAGVMVYETRAAASRAVGRINRRLADLSDV